MTGLLNGRLQNLAARALAKHYLDATLHRSAQTRDGGGDIEETFVDAGVKAQKDRCTEAMRQAPGYTDRDVKIIVLQLGVAPAPTSDDEITLEAVRWSLSMVSADPANTHWTARGTPV